MFTESYLDAFRRWHLDEGKRIFADMIVVDFFLHARQALHGVELEGWRWVEGWVEFPSVVEKFMARLSRKHQLKKRRCVIEMEY
jgi:hypothetical protein